MFKIRTISRVSENSKAFIEEEEYYGASPDLRVSALVSSLIFKHGYKIIHVTITLVDTHKVSQTVESLRVRVDKERR